MIQFLKLSFFSEFGRTCKDIGCLSQETCVMAHESCSYSQRDGKDCGSYPTCKRNPNGGGSGGFFMFRNLKRGLELDQ